LGYVVYRITIDGGGSAILDGGGAEMVTADGVRGATLTGLTVRQGLNGIVAKGGTTLKLTRVTTLNKSCVVSVWMGTPQWSCATVPRKTMA
jgi:hypothetical protein